MVCPFIAICTAKVDYEHYRKYCGSITTENFKNCEHYKKLASETKTPSEWNKAVITRLSPSK